MFPCDSGNGFQLPGGTHLLHHVLGGVPGNFVGFGRVQVRTCAEEQTGEGDEHESQGNIPGGVEPMIGLVAEQTENHHGVNACKENAEPYGGNGKNGVAPVLENDAANSEQYERCDGAEG